MSLLVYPTVTFNVFTWVRILSGCTSAGKNSFHCPLPDVCVSSTITGDIYMDLRCTWWYPDSFFDLFLSVWRRGFGNTVSTDFHLSPGNDTQNSPKCLELSVDFLKKVVTLISCCLYILTPEPWRNPEVSQSVVTFCTPRVDIKDVARSPVNILPKCLITSERCSQSVW